MRFQIPVFKCRHHRYAKILRALIIVQDNPGIIPKDFAKIMWPKLRLCAGRQASNHMRRLKNKGYIRIRYLKFDHVPTTAYEPAICYYLSPLGFEVVDHFTRREQSIQKQIETTIKLAADQSGQSDRVDLSRVRRPDDLAVAQ